MGQPLVVGLILGSPGTVCTETLKAFNEDEYRTIISELL